MSGPATAEGDATYIRIGRQSRHTPQPLELLDIGPMEVPVTARATKRLGTSLAGGWRRTCVVAAEDWLSTRRRYSAVNSMVYAVADKGGGANGRRRRNNRVEIPRGLRRLGACNSRSSSTDCRGGRVRARPARCRRAQLETWWWGSPWSGSGVIERGWGAHATAAMRTLLPLTGATWGAFDVFSPDDPHAPGRLSPRLPNIYLSVAIYKPSPPPHVLHTRRLYGQSVGSQSALHTLNQHVTFSRIG